MCVGLNILFVIFIILIVFASCDLLCYIWQGLAMIRFHSCYPWHTGGAYRPLMTAADHDMLEWWGGEGEKGEGRGEGSSGSGVAGWLVGWLSVSLLNCLTDRSFVGVGRQWMLSVCIWRGIILPEKGQYISSRHSKFDLCCSTYLKGIGV